MRRLGSTKKRKQYISGVKLRDDGGRCRGAAKLIKIVLVQAINNYVQHIGSKKLNKCVEKLFRLQWGNFNKSQKISTTSLFYRTIRAALVYVLPVYFGYFGKKVTYLEMTTIPGLIKDSGKLVASIHLVCRRHGPKYLIDSINLVGSRIILAAAFVNVLQFSGYLQVDGRYGGIDWVYITVIYNFKLDVFDVYIWNLELTHGFEAEDQVILEQQLGYTAHYRKTLSVGSLRARRLIEKNALAWLRYPYMFNSFKEALFTSKNE